MSAQSRAGSCHRSACGPAGSAPAPDIGQAPGAAKSRQRSVRTQYCARVGTSLPCPRCSAARKKRCRGFGVLNHDPDSGSGATEVPSGATAACTCRLTSSTLHARPRSPRDTRDGPNSCRADRWREPPRARDLIAARSAAGDIYAASGAPAGRGVRARRTESPTSVESSGPGPQSRPPPPVSGRSRRMRDGGPPRERRRGPRAAAGARRELGTVPPLLRGPLPRRGAHRRGDGEHGQQGQGDDGARHGWRPADGRGSLTLVRRGGEGAPAKNPSRENP